MNIKSIPLANKLQSEQGWKFEVDFLDEFSKQISEKSISGNVPSEDLDEILTWLSNNNYIKTE